MKSWMKTWILKVNTFSRDINKLQIDIVLVQLIMMMQLYGDVTLPIYEEQEDEGVEITESWMEVDVEKREIDVKEEEQVLLFWVWLPQTLLETILYRAL